MTDWKAELRKTWSLQRDPDDADEVVRSHLITPGVDRPLRAYTASDGSRHLLVPGKVPASEMMRGEALRVESRLLVFDGATDAYLDIGCHVPALFEVFDDLLVSIVADAIDSGDPIDAATGMLARWRDLVRAWSSAMRHEQEMGLYAELHVLELVTRRASMLVPAIWRGPLREPKDLVGGDWWVEVKAVAPSKSYVGINGLDQLSEIDGFDGYLAIATVEESEDGQSIDDAVIALRGRSVSPSAFDDLVLQAGWITRDAPSRWTVTSTDVVPSAVCPRLTLDSSDSVPAGIGRVRYDVDLNVARSLSIRDGVAELLRLGGRS
jgi:hypothetical protein